MARRKKQTRRFYHPFFVLRFLLVALLVVILLPILEVGCARYINPPFTPMMAQRWLEARFEGEQPAPIRQSWIDLNDVPHDFLHFVWAAEDQRFYQHTGIDWKEVEIAMEEARKSGKPPRGASTITMQCARTVFLWQGRSWVRKGGEAYFTLLMEIILGKDRILELYVNFIEMGDGVYGIKAASEVFYDKSPDKLSRRELATLAALLPNPLGWSPINPSPRLIRRTDKILREASRTTFPGDTEK